LYPAAIAKILQAT